MKPSRLYGHVTMVLGHVTFEGSFCDFSIMKKHYQSIVVIFVAIILPLWINKLMVAFVVVLPC